MANISNIIEHFILSTLGDSDDISLSRNDLAEYFNCAPSQINYVLTTRFNFSRGFIIQSQRGGGGYIRLERIKNFDSSYIRKVIDNNLKVSISYKDAEYLLENLCAKKFISLDQKKVLLYAISNRALATPIKMQEKLRANILKSVLMNILKENKRDE